MSSKNSIIKTTTHCIAVTFKFWQIFRVPEVIHITCNMDARDSPDMFALGPVAFRHAYKANPLFPCYNYYINKPLKMIICLISFLPAV